MSIRLVLADDHPLILEALKYTFRHETGFEVLATCTNGEEALKAVRSYRPDVLVLDIRMPRKDGLTVAREIRAENLPTRIVLLTAELDDKQMLEAIRLDVQGIILKEMAPQLLVQCVIKVHAGEKWLERNSTRLAIEKMLNREAAAREIAGTLTTREIELIQMTAKGLRNKDIASKLFISEGTVKVHLHNIYKKLQLKSRMDLLCFARDRDLL